MRWRKYWLLVVLLIVLVGTSAVAFRAYQASRAEVVTGQRQALWIAAQARLEFENLLLSLERFARTGSPEDLDKVHTWFDVFWSRPDILRESRGGTLLANIPGYLARVDHIAALLEDADPLVQALKPGDRAGALAAQAALAPVTDEVQWLYTAANSETDLADVQRVATTRWTYLTLLASLAAVMAMSLLLVALQFWDIRTQERLLAERAAAIESLRQREAELEIASRRAADASQAKSFFLANMSHELRTPLNAILGFSEMIAREMLGPLRPPRYREYADDINRSASHLLEIIDDLLSLTRIEAGKLQIDEEPVDLADVWRFALGMLREKIAQARLNVAQHFPAGLPRLRGDNRAMRQVAINLLSNAIKFTPTGGAVMVVAGLTDAALVITVTDTGIGLSPQEIERVFTPYVQVGNPMVRRDDGVGLGLALVRTLVELHDGRAEIESKPGEGTRVILTFPRSRLIEPGTAEQTSPADIGLSV